MRRKTLLSQHEKNILTKFKNGAVIESEEEMTVLKKWALVGLVRLGVDLEKMKATAKLTKDGKWLLPVL